MYDYDVAVIGGGPGGYVAAIKAAQANKKVCIFEKNTLGGVCLNEGCIPTKALLKSACTFNNISKISKLGIITSNSPALDMSIVQNRKSNIVSTLTNGISFLLKKNKVTIFSECTDFIDVNTLKTADGKITAKNIIIASGSEVSFPPIKIAKNANPLTSKDVLSLDAIPKSTIVIGGGVVGIELAFFLAQAGSKVTVLENMDKILPMIDNDILKIVERDLKAMGINIITNVSVTNIESNTVIYNSGKDIITQDCETVVIATGRKACLDSLSLSNIGLEYNKNGVIVDKHLRTNISNIFAIGDINGISMLAHTASAEAVVAVDTICGIDTVIDYNNIPYCIYLNPEIACIGLSEDKARLLYDNIKIGKFPMIANGKALIEDQTTGMAKVIIDGNTNLILGFHMYGPHATDMISTIGVAMQSKIRSEQVMNTVFPHPTVSESIHEAFLAAYETAIHI